MNYSSILLSLILFVIFLSSNGLAANNATTAVKITGNLDAGASIVSRLPSAFPTFQELNSLATFQVPISVFDSKNVTRNITLFFFHLDQYWLVFATVDGKDIFEIEGAPVIIGSATFSGNAASEVPLTTFYARPHWTGAETADIRFTLKLVSFDNKSLVDRIEFTPSGCEVIEAGVSKMITTEAEKILFEGSSCSASPDSFGVTSGQLAERAIATRKCNERKFNNASDCRRCFDQASAAFRKDYDKRLFRGLFVQANRSVTRQKSITCSK